MVESLATATNNSKLVGEILVESGKVSEEVLATALCVQELLDAQLIDFVAANLLIRQVAEAIRTGPLEQSQSGSPMSFLTFLRAAGYVDNEKLAKLAVDGSQTIAAKPVSPIGGLKIGKPTTKVSTEKFDEQYSTAEIRQLLLKTFPEDRQLINSGVVIFELVRTGKLLVNQGLVVFGFRQHDLNLVGS